MPVVTLRQESLEQGHFYVPQFEIKIAGANLPHNVLRDVTQVTYTDGIKEIDSFELTVNNWDDATIDYKYSDGHTFDVGVLIEVHPNPEEACSQSERIQLLAEAINRLGPKVRTAILLRDIEERTVEETAHILGTTRSAVKARVFQGRRKLRRIITPGQPWESYTPRPRQAQRSN